MVQSPDSPLPHASQLLIGTKLFVPAPRPDLVSRPRLLEQLDAGLSARLILLSGPAGFGKTTLLAEWLGSRRLTACWLSLDPSDNSPATFLSYLLAALRIALPHLGEELLSPLRSSQPPPWEAVLPVLLNELSSAPDGLILVLDDLHVITSPSINAAVAFLLDNLPPQIHLVIATRADPVVPLARLRSRGQLVEIRVEDLRFTAEEAAEFLNRTMGLSLSGEQVLALEERTEGWIAGLQMAALSMRGRKDFVAFIAAFTGSNRFVLDFLVEEVLAREPEEVQDFLLQTSILDQLSGPLCNAVTDRQDGQAMLERLEKTNLFVVPLDDQRRWYRYHHLFGDLLRTRLRESLPELVPLLQSRAAMWYQGEGMIGEAIGYLLEAGANERAAALAERTQLELHKRSDPGLFLKVPALPDDVVRRRPWLSAFRAMLDIVWGRLDEARKWIREAERYCERSGPPPNSADLVPFLRVLYSYAEELDGRDSEMPEAVADALGVLAENKPSLRNSVVYWLAMCHFLHGDFRAAEETWMRVVEEDRRTGATNAIASAVARVATIRLVQGRLFDAAEMCREWLKWLDERGRWRFFRAGHVSEVLGETSRQWNRLEEALALAQRGIEDNRGWRNPHALAFGYASRARVLISMGRLEEAASSLEEVEDTVRGLALQPDVRSDLSACWIQLHLARGDLRAAARWVDNGLIEASRSLGFRRERDGIGLARLLIARGEHSKALALLARLEGSARAGARTGHLIEILTLQALAYNAQKDTAPALSLLGESLTLAEPEGYVRVFVDEGDPLAYLLGRLGDLPVPPSAARFSPEYVRGLLNAFSATSCRPPAIGPGQPALITHRPSPVAHHSLIEPLSERELEVLRLMAEGLTNQQIAARLIIAPGTVRAHVYNISGKLGAQNRTQAVARATELKLL